MGQGPSWGPLTWACGWAPDPRWDQLSHEQRCGQDERWWRGWEWWAVERVRTLGRQTPECAPFASDKLGGL